MKKHIITACLYTAVTAVLLGLVYPLAITVAARVLFPKQAAGELVFRDGEAVGSKLIGQPFTGRGLFHSRPSNAGSGYDASASSGSNLAPSSKALLQRIKEGTAAESTGSPVPVDLVTASGSGLDPDITPAAALYQVTRVARERGLPPEMVDQLVRSRIVPRQLGLFGEPRVNVLELNLALAGVARP